MKTLSKMDKGPLVLAFKYLMGYTKDKTEEFTADFEAFVKTWQKDNGLTADGKIGEKTASILIAKLPNVSKTKNRKGNYAAGVQVLVGMTGDDVDGIFGTKTKTAVINKQTEGKLDGDGVVGSKSWQYFILGEVKEHGKNAKKPPDNKQNNTKWSKIMYSNHNDPKQTIGSSGCGPSAVSDVIDEWWDPKITPVETCEMSLNWGCRTYNSGTSGTFFKKIAEKYKATKYINTSSIKTAIECLDDGGYVIVCFGTGSSGKSWYKKWTTGGHYCCIWKYDGQYFYINDPASTKTARTKGTYDEVLNCRKGFYCFWK